MQQQKVTRPLSYVLDEAQDVRVESTKKNDDLVIQVFPKRKIPTEEAVSRAEGSPVRKIMASMDGILPKKNVSVTDKETYITIHPPRDHFPGFTVVIEKFYDFPTDVEYMKGKVITGLKKLKL